MESSKDEKTQLSPTRLSILPQAGSVPTDVKDIYESPDGVIGESLPDYADFTYLIPRPPRVSKVTEKGLSHWMENREQRTQESKLLQ